MEKTVTIDIKIGMPFQYINKGAVSKTYYLIAENDTQYIIAQKSKKSKSGWKKRETVTLARLKEIIKNGK